MSDHNKITITFTNTAGDYTHDFPENQPLSAVKKLAMAQIGLEVSTADDFGVYLNDLALDENKTLAELSLEDGVVLMIERKKIEKV